MARLTGIALSTDDNTIPLQQSYGDMTTKLSYDSSTNLQYVGKAPAGTQTSGSLWQIKQLMYDSGVMTSTLYASGTIGYDKSWDSRGSYTYL
jgi:hypothetical protein